MGSRDLVSSVLTDENANFDARSEQFFIRVSSNLDRSALRRARSTGMDVAPQGSDKYACQYHPNPAENMIVGSQLAGELRTRLGW